MDRSKTANGACDTHTNGLTDPEFGYYADGFLTRESGFKGYGYCGDLSYANAADRLCNHP